MKVVEFTLLGQRVPGDDRRPARRVQRRDLVRRRVRRPGGARSLLERAARRRRQAGGVRLAHRPLRRALADRAGGPRRDDGAIRTGAAKRVTDAMMKMVKLDIAALKKAYDGRTAT